jgi:3alpha(or 20beta)-hydroxysteroid dehydrogenase
MKYEIPLMLEKGGTIINCGSYSSDHGHNGFSPYVSSKHAMAGITKVAALELATKGITVNSINPYCVETPMLERRAKVLGIKVSDLAGRRPSKKMSKPRDVAELVMYLASDENRILHGQQIDLSMGHNIDF